MEESEYSRYVTEIDLYEREFKPWVSRGKKILKLYKDADNQQGNKKRFNVLWSNVQTLKPALYARDPQPEAERRFKDADPVGRVASEVLERCLSYTVDCHGFGHTMRQAVDDKLLPGRGVAWVRYKPTIDESTDVRSNQITDDAETLSSEELTYEQVIPDYVYWEDFGHNIARTWEEVTIVWRKVYMSRAKLKARFGDAAKDVPLDYSPKGLKDEKTESLKKACIYEIWDRETGKVVFLSKNHDEIIEEMSDPLTLTGMFPCPRPLYSTITNDSLLPVPDYALYQTQAREIEDLTYRINKLKKALKVTGVYDASAPALASLLNDGHENQLVPVDDWAKFAESGGLAGAIDFVPIKDIAAVLIALYEAREKAKADLYEITGISDIIRGNSDPRETAKAQQIKGRFAVLRISDAQEDVQRFARDMMRIMGEIIAEHFTLETIQAISGVKLLSEQEKQFHQMQQQHMQMQQQAAMQAEQTGQPPQPVEPPPLPEEVQELMDQPSWEEVHALLSDQVLRNFRIDIETDSTIRTDEDADRAERTEFLTAAGGYISNAVQAAQMEPSLTPLLTEMLMFGVRGHKAARSLEPIFDDALKEMKKPKPPQPSPEMAKIEAETKMEQARMQMESQLEQQKMQANVQAENQKQQAQHQQEMAAQQMADQRADREHQRSMEMEKYKTDMEIQSKLQIAQIDAETRRQIAKEQPKEKA